MVLWSNLGKDCEVALRKCGREKRKVRRSEQGKCRRGFKPDAAAGLTRNRNATTSACVGWDFSNIENRSALRKHAKSLRCRWQRLSKRLHHHENHDPDHQNRRYLIDNTVKFFSSGIPVHGEILDAAGK